MGIGSSSSPTLSPHSNHICCPSSSPIKFSPYKSTATVIPQTLLRKPTTPTIQLSSSSTNSSVMPLKCGESEVKETHDEQTTKPTSQVLNTNPDLLQKLVYDALVWSSLNGLVVGDKSVQKSGTVPGVGMVHAPFALLPMSFPQSHWQQACELTPIFNELVDRVSLDGKFIQESLSRTKKVDLFTSRLLDIHSKMLEMNKKEEIRLGLHRSDYMLDAETKDLLQIELNTISSSFSGLSCLLSKLHRSLLKHYGNFLGLDSQRVPENNSVNQYAEALAQAWREYNNPRAAVMIVVLPEEHNMYDQHWLSAVLNEKYAAMLGVNKVIVETDCLELVNVLTNSDDPPWRARGYVGDIRVAAQLFQSVEFKHIKREANRVAHGPASFVQRGHAVTTIRRTLAEIEVQGELLQDGTLLIDGQAIAVIYFRAGYAPSDYPSESEWSARLKMEMSSAVKCPSIAYHLTGTKKIQQELAKPGVLERFLSNEDDIVKLRKCFAGLWSLDDSNAVANAVEKPELFVLKPQREGGGNNIYGNDVRETLLKLQKEGSEELSAYILMQRIFPTESPAFLVRQGICHQDHAISELGVYGAYLRNGEKVIINENCGYLMRTKVSSSNEGGVAAGFAVLDSIYLA